MRVRVEIGCDWNGRVRTVAAARTHAVSIEVWACYCWIHNELTQN